MKKNYIFVLLAVIVLVGLMLLPTSEDKKVTTEEAVSEGPREPVIINKLQYHENMKNAQMSGEALRLPFGTKDENVGGFLQDTERYSQGFPWTFRVTEDENFWILDSINKKLKLFSKTGDLVNFIPLDHLGANVVDFAYHTKDGIVVFAFLNNVSGELFITDEDGNVIDKHEPFITANSIEFTRDGDLLVDLPIAKGIAKIAQDGKLQGVYEGDERLKSVDAKDGGIYELEFKDKKATLSHRKDYPAASAVKLTEFEYELDHKLDVWFTSGDIYGYDKEDNIYLGLMVCDIRGVIYRERIYKCSPTGEILSHTDTISDPIISAASPRRRVLGPNKKVYFHHHKENDYIIGVHSMP